MINRAGEMLIKEFEEKRLHAYLCPANVWTIGWGHTRGVRPGMVISDAQAQQLFVEDVAEAESYVSRLVTVALTENQRAALVSFTFNVGPDIDADKIAEGLGDSTLLKKLNAGDYQGAADEFLKWVKAGRVVLRGLVRRREKERRLFLLP